MDTSNTEKKVIQSCMLRNAQFDIYAQYAKNVVKQIHIGAYLDLL